MEGSSTGSTYPEWSDLFQAGDVFADEVAARSAYAPKMRGLPCGCHHTFVPRSEKDFDPEFDPANELVDSSPKAD
ncbi:MAG: hypothetical protein WCW66_05830 [Patescibacteria group bacterium]|jgi:hypothetical protein